MSRRLVLGTRGSALALAQVELVKQALIRAETSLDLEVKKITTSGDRSAPAGAWIKNGAGLKGMFTKEIEEALLAGEIDIAVHSCKDLPGQLSPGCAVRAVLARAATDDVLLSKKSQRWTELPVNACIATCSVRRRHQLLWLRPDLLVMEMRGNVPTRLRKLRESDSLDGIVLARAGLDRLGYSLRDGWLDFAGAPLFAETLPILPAIGQGAIALEARTEDEVAAHLLAKINHMPTWQCIRAERELLRLLEGDCRLPVGAKTEVMGDRLKMSAILFTNENPPRTAEAAGRADEPEALAQTIFQTLQTDNNILTT